jgi:hypothetical protein
MLTRSKISSMHGMKIEDYVPCWSLLSFMSICSFSSEVVSGVCS